MGRIILSSVARFIDLAAYESYVMEVMVGLSMSVNSLCIILISIHKMLRFIYATP